MTATAMAFGKLLSLPPVCVVLTLVLAIGAATDARAQAPRARVDFERLPFAPVRTVVFRTASPLNVDGKLDEPAWRATAWSDRFVDIQGVDVPGVPAPRFNTRVKMLWDADYFYVAAEMDEPDVWGTLTARDSIIFQDNDFEVFIDPDGDTHHYFELEVNALGTAWDLFLPQPYRDGGSALHSWDITGLKVGVDVRGTINKPGDRDEGWSVELAIPWNMLNEAAPGRRSPRDGDRWRVNFSRVEWQIDVVDGRYTKRIDPKTGKPFPEDNWVWSPQGAINMHMPERWGFVQFSDAQAGASSTGATFVDDPNERVKWALRRLYYRQGRYRQTHGRYASDLAALDASNIKVDGLAFQPKMQVTDSLYEISAPGFDGAIVHLRQDGKTWLTRPAAPGTPTRGGAAGGQASATPAPVPPTAVPPGPAASASAVNVVVIGDARPGDAIIVRAIAPSASVFERATVNVFNRVVPLWRTDDPLTWEALVGIDVDTPVGSYPLIVEGHGPAGPTMTSSEMVKVEPKVFGERKLRVDSKYSQPPASERARIAREAKRLEAIFRSVDSPRHWLPPFARPVTDPANSNFGLRSVFNGQPRGRHNGVDFASARGTPVHAPAAGRVSLADALYFTGNTVVIDHGQGLYSLFAHFDRIAVSEGATVSRGDLIGHVGATGRATGPHLHWSVRLHSARVDPLTIVALYAGQN